MLVDRLANYAVWLRTATFPQGVEYAAKRCMIDWFAALLPGGILPPATLLLQALRDDLNASDAVIFPRGDTASMRTAALINGSAAHTVEFDDIYRDALYHPGAPVIAAALAASQARHTSGDTLLRGVIAGYEISNRIGVAINPAHYEYWHTTGTVGTFGATAAAAVILGLDEEQIAHALANAGTFAAGLQQAFRSDAMSKPLHAGRAAETGVLVALAAEQGVTGAKDILEGPRGFGAAMSEDADWYGAFAGLRERFTITRTTQKNHGACGHTFAAVDAVIALRQQHELSALSAWNIKSIEVGTYAKALEITGNTKPRTAFEAKFSLPYCAAVALLTGQVRLNAFAPERLNDPLVHEIMSRVSLHVDDKIESEFPRRRAATVKIKTVDGKRYRYHADTRKGDPDNPLSDAELTAKYRELAVPVIGQRPAESLLDLLWRLETLKDTTRLRTGRQTTEAVGFTSTGV